MHSCEIRLDDETYKNLFEEAKLLGPDYVSALAAQKKRQDEQERRSKVLDELTEEAQEMGLYDTTKKK